MGDDKYTKGLRLLDMVLDLLKEPAGMSAHVMAQKYGVNVRTIYRDLKNIEDRHILPLYKDNGKWKILPGQFLPPISFNLSETLTLFLASRLLLSYSNAYNINIATTFQKLSTIVPHPLHDQILKTIERLQKLKPDQRFTHTLEKLTRAWLDQRRAKIRYWTLGKKESQERVIEPYFIQPAALEHANYVIAYCRRAKEIRVFKVERIESIEVLDEEYQIPQNFDANDYLGSNWGITTSGRVETIKLRFAPDIARIAQETTWHPSQVTQKEFDGSALVTMRLSVTVQLETFILGWGEKVEVLAPPGLRRRIAQTADKIVDVYAKRQEL